MSDETFKLEDYKRNWLYLTEAVEGHLNYYPKKLYKYVNLSNLPKNAMFKLTYNNFRLMVYFSFRSSFTQPGSHIELYSPNEISMESSILCKLRSPDRSG